MAAMINDKAILFSDIQSSMLRCAEPAEADKRRGVPTEQSIENVLCLYVKRRAILNLRMHSGVWSLRREDSYYV